MGKKRKWTRCLVMFCIGTSLGVFGTKAYAGEWEKAVGWLVAAIYAVGWRVEMENADEDRADADYWKNLWLNSEATKSYENAFSNSEPPVLDDPEKKDA
jgi:hypothetical protein